jgi:regulator of sigma E protease
MLFALLGLALLVLAHEAGHFVTAIATRMRPQRFYVGFPPPLAKIERGGVEYGIGAIPLGGYVKIPGMFRPSARDVSLYFEPALKEDSELGPHLQTLREELEQGRFDSARGSLAGLERQLAQAKFSPASTRLANRGLDELGGALRSDSYWSQKAWKRFVVIGSGPATNLLIAIAIFAALLMLTTYRVGFNPVVNEKTKEVTTVVRRVIPGTPAQRAGLHRGDVVITVNGEKVSGATLVNRIAGSGGRPITFTVRRQGRLVKLRAVKPMKISGDSLPVAIGGAAELGWRITRDIVVNGLGRLFVGRGTKEVSGPVGIVKGSSDAYKQGFADYLWVVGLISLSLGVLNLLPLLPLDGGHIAFTAIERVSGRVIPREIYERVSMVGIALVAILFVLGISNDVGRISS